MTDDGATGDHVGSVAEEAAKLFGALHSWAEDAGAGNVAAAADGLRREWAEGHRADEQPDAHPATCRHCPVCRVLHAVQQTDPAVRAHLSSAASSLLQAGLALLAGAGPSGERPDASGGVEKIDLDGDDDAG